MLRSLFCPLDTRYMRKRSLKPWRPSTSSIRPEPRRTATLCSTTWPAGKILLTSVCEALPDKYPSCLSRGQFGRLQCFSCFGSLCLHRLYSSSFWSLKIDSCLSVSFAAVQVKWNVQSMILWCNTSGVLKHSSAVAKITTQTFILIIRIPKVPSALSSICPLVSERKEENKLDSDLNIFISQIFSLCFL